MGGQDQHNDDREDLDDIVVDHAHLQRLCRLPGAPRREPEQPEGGDQKSKGYRQIHDSPLDRFLESGEAEKCLRLPLTARNLVHIFRPPAGEAHRAGVPESYDESAQFASLAQKARQGLPHHPAQRAHLRDQ